jgi:tetratricopeptide (TPR) repeat protein
MDACADQELLTRSLREEFPRIDGYKIVREIGRGGMGVVYEATEEKLSRRVALKILPGAALFDANQVRRFEREAQAAARLHHTNIVPVFGVSRQDEHPYFVMQYIEGSGLDRVLAELRRLRRAGEAPSRVEAVRRPDEPGGRGAGAGAVSGVTGRTDVVAVARSLGTGTFAASAYPQLPDPATGDGSVVTAVFSPPFVCDPAARPDVQSLVLAGSTELSNHSQLNRSYFEAVAKIGLQAAEALDYASRQGVLHRDIKPSNLLLDTQGNVWVADFGLAKITETEDITCSGQLVGTTRYMAPERFQGQCDGRSDVYSLGLTLYELVSLRPAFDASERAELIERICNDEPARLKKLEPRVPQDLETIIHKAIAGEPARRYHSAKEMGEDLNRFLKDLPIKARRASRAERVGRWCRRNPWATASIALLVAGTVVSLWQAARATKAERSARLAAQATIKALIRAESEAARALDAEAATRKERDRAEAEAAISKAVKEFLQQDMLAQASAFNQLTLRTTPDPDLKVRTALERAAAKIGERFAGQPLVEASIRQTVGETYYQLGLYRQALPHLQRALNLRRSLLGGDDPDTLLAMRSVGIVYLADGKLSEAQALLVGAMTGLKKARPADDPDLLDAMTLVADLDYNQRKLTEAERLLSQVREAHLKKLGPDDPKTLDVTNTLGLVYLEENKPELAERTLTDVRHRLEKTIGSLHPLALQVKQNLSDVYSRRSKKNEAIRLSIETIDGQTKAIGRKHPDTLRSIVKLGMLYTESGSLDKAEPLLKEALAECRKALDRNHETTVAALGGLAVVYVSKRNMTELGVVLIEAVEILRIRWGLHDATTASANLSAATFFLLQFDYARAEPYLGDYLQFWTTKNPGHGNRYLSELTYGVCLLAQRKFTEAQSHLLVGYNGLRPDRENAPLPETADLGRLMYMAFHLPGANGRPLGESTLSIIRKDPRLGAIVLDLQFPADPFAAR